MGVLTALTGRARQVPRWRRTGPSGPGALRIVYVCKAVDEADPCLANQVRWIRTLAARDDVEHVTVLTPRQGRASLPANVTVRSFGAEPPLRFLRVVGRFNLAMARGPAADLYFVSQGGPYPVLLLPWKLATGRPLYQWKAMPHISGRMRFYARFCDDLIFTATPGSFPLASDKVRVVGHGIDTDLFRPTTGTPPRDLVYVTRITPVKRLDHAVRVVDECRRRFGRQYTLDIVGPCDSRSRDHERYLSELVRDLDLTENVRFLGSVSQAALPELLGRYRAAVNFAETAFDKSAGEAMASGLPVITSNARVTEVLPVDLRPVLSVAKDDVAAAAGTVHQVLAWDDERRAEVGSRLSRVIVEGHGLGALFDKILAEIRTGPATAS